MNFFKRIKKTIDIAEGWFVISIQAIIVIILELVSVIFLSDCISMLVVDNPDLRAQIIWLQLGVTRDGSELLVFYTVSLAMIYVFLILVQHSFLMRTALIAYDLSSKVFSSLGVMSYTDFSNIDKPNLSAVLVPETQRAASAVIAPVFNLISKVFMVISIFVYLGLQLGPLILLVALLFVPYIGILAVAVRWLQPNSLLITKYQASRQGIIAELYAADKSLYFTKHFERLKTNFKILNKKLGFVLGQSSTLVQLPKYIIELSLGFAALTGIIILYEFRWFSSEDITFFKSENSSLLLVALLKMLPAIQQIYRSTSMITGNFSSLENVFRTFNNIIESKNIEKSDLQDQLKVADGDRKGFSILDTEFKVYGKKVKLTKAKIKLGDILVISGQSGLGKTTICENLLHLRNDLNIQSLKDLQHYPKFTGSLFSKVGFAGQAAFCDIQGLDLVLNLQKQISSARLNQLIFEWNLSGLLATVLKEKSAVFSELSGGQKRKLSLLVALLSDAPIVFLDEPTNDLDKKSRKVLIELILEMTKNRKRIFLIITHDEDLKKIATKYSELNEA